MEFWFQDCCWNLQDTYQQVYLLKDNDIEFNEKNEIELFYPFLESYLQHLFHIHNFLIVTNDNKEEERIYQFDISNILKNIMNGKIILRDKKSFRILSLFKLFSLFENRRLQFIQEIKKINVHSILQKIDEQYIQANKDSHSIKIGLSCCEIPNFTIYQYLMTFQRNKCSLLLENECLFLDYQEKGYTYRMQFYDNTYDIPNIKYASFIRNCSYHNMNIKKRIIYQKENYYKYLIDFEKKYVQSLFQYYGIDFMDELTMKYRNYEFQFCSNNAQKEERLNNIELYMF
jgi:predicted ribonuclease toxin of YeeF-YezG toxin-antitoxin module